MNFKELIIVVIFALLAVLALCFPLASILKAYNYPLEANLVATILDESSEMEVVVRNDRVLNLDEVYIPTRLAREIIHCESSGDPLICNRKNGCGAGAGLFGIIQTTWNETLIKMSNADEWMPEDCWQFIDYSQISKLKEYRDEPVFDPVCNTLMGLFLLETKGTKPWGTKETVGKWGSYSCWKDYLSD